MTPVSLFAAINETNDAPPRALANASISIRPPEVTGTRTSSREKLSAQRKTALCSMADTTTAPGAPPAY
jgi:hypothetical protein